MLACQVQVLSTKTKASWGVFESSSFFCRKRVFAGGMRVSGLLSDITGRSFT